MSRFARPALWIGIAAWCVALAYSTLSGRVLYADGALYVMVHVQRLHVFDDYDFHRSFASFVSQAPILLGQRLGITRMAAYAALYDIGALVVPALALMAALLVSGRQPRVFAFTLAGAVVFGFGINFINSEANLLFGLAWLSVAILALDAPSPVLRGFVLPLAALVMLRTYEGMLVAGPVLCAWALLGIRRSGDNLERTGLALSALLFAVGAAIGFGGWLSPRDPANAQGFVGSAFRFLHNPQLYLLLAALAAWPAIALGSRAFAIAGAVLGAIAGIAFLRSLAALQGYYAYAVYYENRTFLAFLLPLALAAALMLHWRRPAWFAARAPRDGYWVLLVPLLFAVAGDVMGTRRWNDYVHEFCTVLRKPMAPAERLAALEASGAVMGWPWTHPVMSALLRDRGSDAVVSNEPGQRFEPGIAGVANAGYAGFCEAPFLDWERR